MDVAELGGLRLWEGEAAGMVEAGSMGCSWETAGIDLPWQQQFCACSHGRHVVPGSWGPESVLPLNIKGAQGSGMDVLDHIPVHAGQPQPLGLPAWKDLSMLKKIYILLSCLFVLLFLGRRMAIRGEAGLQEQLGGKQCSSCTHVLKSTHPRVGEDRRS